CEKPVLSRMIVILAGSIMNFILPVVIFFGIYLVAGVSTPNTEPVFGTVIAGKAADQAGLKAGDRIISLDGKEISTWTEFVDNIKDNEGTAVTVVAERNGEKITATMTPAYDSQAQRAMVGVMSSVDWCRPVSPILATASSTAWQKRSSSSPCPPTRSATRVITSTMSWCSISKRTARRVWHVRKTASPCAFC
ncbi:MAG: site-2 protease family protein, partial [Ruminococcus sp.]|nr:site-2 protease family protein [Ruminococcus sp.]